MRLNLARRPLAAGVLVLLMAVPAGARAAQGWSAPVKIDSHELAAISCVPGFCAAVDTSGDATVYRGGAWSAPVNINGTTGLLSVSCTSSTFCMSVGLGTSSSTALMWNGTSWVSTPLPNAGVEDVSCASAQFCVAVGPGVGGEGGTPSAGNFDTYDNGTWTPAPTGGIDQGRATTGVSCVAQPSIFCTAVDQDGGAVTYSPASGWSQIDQIDTFGAAITGVTCASASLCFATDNQSSAVSVYDGSGWSAFNLVNGAPLGWISCASTTFCGGLGGPGVEIYDGSSWTATADPPAGTDALSCPVAGSCVAVTTQGDYTTYPSSTTPPPPPPAKPVSVGKLTTSGDRVTVSLTCPADDTNCGPVTVEATVSETLRGKHLLALAARAAKTTRKEVVIASRTVTLTAGQSEKLTLSPNSAGRRLLAKHPKLAAIVSVGSNGKTLKTSTVHLSAA